MKIAVVQRFADYIAYLDDDATKWGAGRTHYEAIGNLICAFSVEMDIDIEVKRRAA